MQRYRRRRDAPPPSLPDEVLASDHLEGPPPGLPPGGGVFQLVERWPTEAELRRAETDVQLEALFLRDRGPSTRPQTADLPTRDEVEAMPEGERRALLLKLASRAQEVAAAQTMVAALVTVRSDEPLWTTKQTAKVLNLSEDTVRERGAEWGIEADLGEGLHRYVPERVRALRDRRKQAEKARLDGRRRLP